MVDNWSTLQSMKPFIQEAWKKTGFSQATPIQEKAIPLLLEGKDIVAESPTGTGKTLAYLLPLLNKVDPEKSDIQAVVLASSHELVMQIFQEFQKWSQGSNLTGASFIGGVNVARQLEKLKKRPQIIFGTPGRVLELIKQKKMKMHEVKTIVIDEGDQLLVPEHLNTIKDIVKSTLKDRQISLFSATLTDQAKHVAKEFLKEDAVDLKVERPEIKTAANVEHLYFLCDPREKIEILAKISRLENVRGLVFVKDIGSLSVLAEKLNYKGVSLAVLHSDVKKIDRQTALNDFRAGKSNLLLATDVAARGLDIQGITHVIHYDVAKDVTEYTHRSGRTGRLGSESGTVINIMTHREARELKQIADKLNIPLHEKDFYQGKIVEKRVQRKPPFKPNNNKKNSNSKPKSRAKR